MHNKIIISGRGGAGKDQAADYLVEEYGFKKIAFADGIYEIARKYFGMQNKDRKLLQDIGQKMREIEPLIWVKYTFEKAKNYEKVVISDCRQGNEYIYGLENEFLPLRIDTYENIRIRRLTERDGKRPNISLLENESETGADDYTYIYVDNNGRVMDLNQQLDTIMSREYSENLAKIKEDLLAK